MDIDLPTLAPLAVMMTEQTERKRRSGRNTALAVGTLIILSDGSECVVAGYDANGNLLCYPVQE